MDIFLFTVATVDNIDFLQRHSFVFHGDQGCSWHIQVVHTRAGKNQEYDNVESITIAGQDQETVQHVNPTQVVKKRATLPVSKLSPTLTSKSPTYKKDTRRSRSLAEYKTPVPTERRSLFSTVNADSYAQPSYTPRNQIIICSNFVYWKMRRN